MIFSGCFRRTKTHNPFKHDGFVILVRTSGRRERTRTNERAKEGGREGNRGIASARARGFLARSFVRSFDFVRRVRFRRVRRVASRPSVGGDPSVRAIRSGEKVDSTSTGGALYTGLFRGAVRDGWMDGCRDGRTARDASETSSDARANDEKKEGTARTDGGDRRTGRRPASRDGARCRAMAREQPTARVRVMGRVCVSCVSSRDS